MAAVGVVVVGVLGLEVLQPEMIYEIRIAEISRYLIFDFLKITLP